MIMKNLTLLTLITSTFLLNGCSSHKVLYESETHLYSNNYGIIDNYYHDYHEEQRILSQNEAVYTSFRSNFSDDPTLTTELKHDPDAFTLDQWVEPEPIITYKYMHNSKFFTEDELPENKLLTVQEIDRLDSI